MKVCVTPIPVGLSQAMYRVARALEVYAPSGISFVPEPKDADIQIVHVIGPDGGKMIRSPDYAAIHYCSGVGTQFDYTLLWNDAKTVWSYLDLEPLGLENYYRAPLGVDRVFTQQRQDHVVRSGVMSSGYVSSTRGEAIEEVAMAGWVLNMNVLHLGPAVVEGMKISPPSNWRSILGVSDMVLADYYRGCKWVSGLRHDEGFELPVIEGLACGARPLVFDRPDMRYWYDGHAVFIPECSGPPLLSHLLDVLGDEPDPVLKDEREWVAKRFDWKPIVQGFWERVL